MCTLIVAWQVFEGAPLLIASNRDEYLDRESEPPAMRDWGATVVAPKDAQAGGTWFGYNEHDVVAAVTNRWLDADIEGERSRGLLVRDALEATSADEAVRTVERELDTRTYAGFHLFVADRSGAFLVESGTHRRITPLEAGVHVIVNVGADGRYSIPADYENVAREQAANADTVRNALRPDPGESPENWIDRAGTVLGDHEYGVCIHRDGFGTKSAALLSMTGEGITYQYAAGPPCETPFEVVSESV